MNTVQDKDTARERKLPHFRSLQMVRTPVLFTVMISCVILIMIASVVAAMFLPWRQSVTGTGRIIVFSPMDRPQTIEAQIPGRIVNWFVRDGQDVEKGQKIVSLAELDSRFLDNTQLKTLLAQKTALIAKREALKARADALSDQVNASAGVRKAAVPATIERVKQANDRVYQAEQAVEAAKQSLKTAQWQSERVESLFNDGLRSKRDKELAELDTIRSKTELERALAALDVAKEDTSISLLENKRTEADTGGNINAIKAARADANQLVASTEADIYKLQIDIDNFEKRVDQRTVDAPCSGRIVRLLRVGAGAMVNAGDVLAVIAPHTQDRAAEINIRDWDAPLVSVGRPVRLQIAGWPALQFIGWPRIAIGTFAGVVSVIDATDDGKNRYRVIVEPDKTAIANKQADPWPSTTFLRPGAQVTGWILLSDVPLWYELWRQLNGWQPTIQPQDPNNPNNPSNQIDTTGRDSAKRKSP
ncbi:MAG: secretion protein HlyD [Candidatus Melainabacteria bacterium]|nr:MAG: secretion protein HlyD [Candidatus Melainabacteria bacterium]